MVILMTKVHKENILNKLGKKFFLKNILLLVLSVLCAFLIIIIFKFKLLSGMISVLVVFAIILVTATGYSIKKYKLINHPETEFIRDARVDDIEFIFKNILEGSKNGYFHPDLYKIEKAKLGLKENIRKIVEDNSRLDSNRPDSWAFIYEKDGLPISVLILSRSFTQGFEIWIVATEKEYQNNGYAQELLNFILNNFKNQNTVIEAQCYTNSEIMIKMLKNSGFEQVKNNSHYKNLYRISCI